MESCTPRIVKARGLSLIELLVALSLLSVVTLMGWLMLASIRNIADELLAESPDTLHEALAAFENDLAHLIRSMEAEGDPDFQLKSDGTAKWLTATAGATGHAIPTRVSYLPPDNEGNWRRTAQAAGQTQIQTNLLYSAVQSLTLSVYREEETWSPEWPPEASADVPSSTALPKLIRVDMETTDGQTVRRNFLVPAAMRLVPPDTEDQISN
ncbi:MAG: prepilin-type N-terminal cleavage/methylation domain-containing protein [Verrucomicrobia bacterium]|nr:prepilin-type N-terminal cleavage/methylation domain-containing protein [Verrucomicrobiota bacterium]MCH8512776.1 type II secretion system protein GspJ [Kiritimatiellia bacterium]